MTKQQEFNKAIEEHNPIQFKLLLDDKNITPIVLLNYVVQLGVDNNKIELIEILLNDSRVNPSLYKNSVINYAFHQQNINVINLLWKDKRVKSTLKNDNIKLYNKLVQQDIKNKASQF